MYVQQSNFSGVIFRVSRLVRIKQVVRCKMIGETKVTKLNDAFYYFCLHYCHMCQFFDTSRPTYSKQINRALELMLARLI